MGQFEAQRCRPEKPEKPEMLEARVLTKTQTEKPKSLARTVPTISHMYVTRSQKRQD